MSMLPSCRPSSSAAPSITESPTAVMSARTPGWTSTGGATLLEPADTMLLAGDTVVGSSEGSSAACGDSVALGDGSIAATRSGAVLDAGGRDSAAATTWICRIDAVAR